MGKAQSTKPPSASSNAQVHSQSVASVTHFEAPSTPTLEATIPSLSTATSTVAATSTIYTSSSTSSPHSSALSPSTTIVPNLTSTKISALTSTVASTSTSTFTSAAASTATTNSIERPYTALISYNGSFDIPFTIGGMRRRSSSMAVHVDSDGELDEE
ncbi:hypothetical protein SVAN01_04651 [Stagonosporopsis vannaccii]|nr:hypothetical protein SVAN01_04651 [Stagonosporopsis vannaccii]